MKNFYRILQYKKPVIAVFFISIILIIFAICKTEKSTKNFLIDAEVKNDYKHEFVILNKSFKRDLDRSEILYKSFEKYFIDAEKIPFFIVIPARDWRLFLGVCCASKIR